MPKILKKLTLLKLPKSKQEERGDEYGKARKGFVVCKRCRNIFFKKEWHRPDQGVLRQAMRAGKAIHFALCPACAMIEHHLHEGEIFIENTPIQFESELIHLINGFAKRAELKDPQDRIIELEKENNQYHITTTENQLAVKLAKKIKNVFKGVKLHIAYSKEPHEVDRVVLKFL